MCSSMAGLDGSNLKGPTRPYARVHRLLLRRTLPTRMLDADICVNIRSVFDTICRFIQDPEALKLEDQHAIVQCTS
jgi:hypothetical protein